MDTNTLSRLELTSMLVDAALRVTMKFGRDELAGGLPGHVNIVREPRLTFLYRTPKAMAIGSPNFGIDIWFDHSKVFSVCWNLHLIKDIQLISLKRGPWIPLVFEIAARAETVDLI